MHLFVSGVNHKRAPVEVREKLALMADGPDDTVQRVMQQCPVKEAVVLSTCNRFEVYGVTEEASETPEFVRPFFVTGLGVDQEAFRKHFYYLQMGQAVEHLFEVASSLDSMVLGEAQILAQVKEAFRASSEQKTTGKTLNRLFQKAIEIGKRVRTETSIGKNAVSVSYVAVELARKIFGTLEGKTAMVIGVGEMSQLTLGHLVEHGVKKVLVANRTYQGAVNLAARFDGEAVEFDKFPSRLSDVDIVVSSTAASGFILTARQVEAALESRYQEPVLIVDIAVPRDIDPEVQNLSNVYLYNIDDLQSVVDHNFKEREAAAVQARRIVYAGRNEFLDWLNSLRVVPVIEGLLRRADRIAEDELAKLSGKLSTLTDAQREAVKAAIRAATNKLLHAPLTNLKKLAQEEASSSTLELVRDLFDLQQ